MSEHRHLALAYGFVAHLNECAQCREVADRVWRVLMPGGPRSTETVADDAMVARLREIHEGLCERGKHLFELGRATTPRPS